MNGVFYLVIINSKTCHPEEEFPNVVSKLLALYFELLSIFQFDIHVGDFNHFKQIDLAFIALFKK